MERVETVISSKPLQNNLRRTVATIEARTTSSRLPGKVLLPAAGKPLLEHLIERVRRIRYLDEIVVATTVNPEDNSIAKLAAQLRIACYRGSETDVLARVLGAAQSCSAEVIVEITGDCPLIDPIIAERCIEEYFATGADYVSNVLQPSYPNGMDTQVFATRVLKEVAELTQDPADREHVSLYIYSHPEKYSLVNLKAPIEQTRPALRLCVDTQEDYRVVKTIFDKIYPTKPDFSLADVLAFLDSHPHTAPINAKVHQRTRRE
jgi:spore coat polysaccharide biosynthesis protein SpsF